jgi:uncharacterized protein (DUF2384 family)
MSTTLPSQEEAQLSGTTAYADEVRRVRAIGIETGDIAQVAGAEKGTVTAWARADRRPAGEYRKRLLELVSLIERLSRVMDQGYIPLWLNKPLPALDDKRPIEALAKGRYREVSRLVSELENDFFS